MTTYILLAIAVLSLPAGLFMVSRRQPELLWPLAVLLVLTLVGPLVLVVLAGYTQASDLLLGISIASFIALSFGTFIIEVVRRKRSAGSHDSWNGPGGYPKRVIDARHNAPSQARSARSGPAVLVERGGHVQNRVEVVAMHRIRLWHLSVLSLAILAAFLVRAISQALHQTSMWDLVDIGTILLVAPMFVLVLLDPERRSKRVTEIGFLKRRVAAVLVLFAILAVIFVLAALGIIQRILGIE